MLCSLVATLVLTATAYSPTVAQNDADPWTTACGTRPFVGSVAVSQDLFWTSGFGCGDSIVVNGKRVVVNDTMHWRIKKTVDLWVPTKRKADRLGRRPAVVCRWDGRLR